MIKALDYYLLPVYIALATLIISALKKKLNPDKSTYKIFYTAFFIKLAGGLLFSFIIQYYYGYGDSIVYFEEARILHNHVTEDVSNIRYFFSSVEEYRNLYDSLINPAVIGLYDDSSLMVIRITAFFTFLSFNTYLTTTVFFVLLSFSGMWAIYLTFISIAPRMKTLFAWGILYLPSIIFWGSGIMKDTISITALGWLFYCLYKFFFVKERKAFYLICILFSVYLVIAVKAYILLAFSFTLLLVFVFYSLFKLRPIYKRVIFTLVLFTAIGLLFFTQNFFSDFVADFSVDMVAGNIEQMQKLYVENSSVGEGNFSIGTIDPSLSGILAKVPASIVTVLYRPFIWESKKIIMLFSGLENLILMILTVYVIFRTGIINFFKIISRNPLVQFCLFFTLSLAVIVGLTTFNFGTLLRYRIPCMPFYTSFLILVRYYAGLKNKEGTAHYTTEVSFT